MVAKERLYSADDLWELSLQNPDQHFELIEGAFMFDHLRNNIIWGVSQARKQVSFSLLTVRVKILYLRQT